MCRLVILFLINVVYNAASRTASTTIVRNVLEPGLLHRFGAKTETKKDNLFVDAGSSGSKVFAFHPEKAGAKLLTECLASHQAAGRTAAGIAALGYNKSECEWQVGVAGESNLHALARATPDYAEALLRLLADTYQSASKQSNLNDVANKDEVPMLATAGMRLISQSTNKKVWSYICGRAASGLKLATAGEKCGTIPGTTEAYYEFLANAANGRGSKTLTGIFTIGGASAQIAIPLKTESDVAAFLRLKENISQELDCTKLMLQDGNVAPMFNRKGGNDPRTNCLDDYVSFRPRSEIKASVEVLADSVRHDEIQGLGLVSFLGLRGSGSFVAGGLNELEHWAHDVGCDSDETEFSACVEKLRAALSKDILWKHVTQYFMANAFNIDDFSYNTHSARPKSAGLSGVDGQDQAWELEKELQDKCEADNGAHFGYKKSNSCMRAMFTSMYITSFFAKTEDPPAHSAHELHFDPIRDWAEGINEEARAFLQTHVRSLLQSPVHWHEVDYADGAMLHFDP